MLPRPVHGREIGELRREPRAIVIVAAGYRSDDEIGFAGAERRRDLVLALVADVVVVADLAGSEHAEEGQHGGNDESLHESLRVRNML